MARKMKTMDGTMQRLMLPMHTQTLQQFTQSHLHLLWQKLQTSGQHREERTSLDRKYRLQRSFFFQLFWNAMLNSVYFMIGGFVILMLQFFSRCWMT